MKELPRVCRAAKDGDLDLLKQLVESGFSINEVGPGDVSPLYCAVHERRYEVVSWLVQNGANINARTKKDPGYPGAETACYLAVELEDPRLLSILLESGADPNLKSSNGSSPLGIAADKQRIDLVKQLVTSGAKPSRRSNSDSLINSLLRRNIEIATYLINNGADANSVNSLSGVPVVFTAASSKWLPGVELLVNAGADTSRRSSDGQTALHHAVLGYGDRNIQTVKIGSESKTVVDDPEEALLVIEYLLQMGIDSGVKDIYGLTASDYAMKMNAKHIQALIVKGKK